MEDWASLPADLINRVADRLLATDDLDYYMDLRAVCRGWRSSTNSPRFRPRQWAMLDEVHQSDDARLFVNAGTGRFVRKDLSSLLRRYLLVAGAAGGSVVLAERTAPHAARVLNPFTGAMVRFEAPVPFEGKVAAHVIGIGSSPTLVLLSDHSIYWAGPDSGSFTVRKVEHMNPNPHSPFRFALEGGIYAAAREHGSLASLLVPEATKIFELAVAAEPFAQYFAGGAEGQAGRGNNRCFLVESAGEMLIVFKLPHRVEVFRMEMDNGSNVLERVRNLGSRALFVGKYRCLSVDADKFASVEANCVYYVEEEWFDVCVYSLTDETEVMAGSAIDSFNPITLSVDRLDPPFSEVQLLCCYTFEARRYSQLEWYQLYFRFVEDHLIASSEWVDELAGHHSESDDFSDIQPFM